ncbi:hypothetical protein KIPB_003724 [Kipferlia bialata]|uniref:Uncharacterized protein n=1 Tax=Kipferlia bialata TaxID=797122 RepID=A0A9K3CSQ5_9EUKA|nr:hypothetical protein KIPB_003724 [Kipferlia bialata]|eukprot:g3724.t1
MVRGTILAGINDMYPIDWLPCLLTLVVLAGSRGLGREIEEIWPPRTMCTWIQRLCPVVAMERCTGHCR